MELDPTDASARFVRGLYLTGEGLMAEALVDLDAAVEAEPDNGLYRAKRAVPAFYLAGVRRDRALLDAAVADCERRPR